MNWSEVRKKHKNRWVLIEELKSESKQSRRIILDMSVINNYDNCVEALNEYIERHKKDKGRKIYVCHTKHEDLIISERKWIGIRVTP